VAPTILRLLATSDNVQSQVAANNHRILRGDLSGTYSRLVSQPTSSYPTSAAIPPTLALSPLAELHRSSAILQMPSTDSMQLRFDSIEESIEAFSRYSVS